MDCILIILGFMVLCFTVQVQGKEIPCGRRGWKKNPRIIGGTDNAIQGQVPWITSLRYGDGDGKGVHMCGGTIIHRRFLVVAAHCFSTNNMMNPENWTATMGQVNKSFDGTTMQVEKIILHPGYVQYNNTNNKFDIAVLKLSQDIEWTDHIQPACLPNDDLAPGTKVAFSGWGQSRNPTSDDDLLQTVSMIVYANDHCQELIRDWKVLTILDSQLCAGNGTEGGVYISDGDSGGGLMAFINGRWTIAAVASYIPRESFLSGDIPSVFTRVKNFKKWIERTAAIESQ